MRREELGREREVGRVNEEIRKLGGWLKGKMIVS